MQHVKTGWVLAFAMILGLVAFAVGAQDPDKATTGPESEAMTAPTTEATAEEPDEAPVDESLVLIQLAETIAGQENKPAGEVFSNVQVLRSVPAGRFLRIMRLGFSRSLGVSCDYCHSSSDWASDDNSHKRIARQMAMLTEELNDKLLPAIPELAGQDPRVNCTTCHRGDTKPALSMDEEGMPAHAAEGP